MNVILCGKIQKSNRKEREAAKATMKKFALRIFKSSRDALFLLDTLPPIRSRTYYSFNQKPAALELKPPLLKAPNKI